jgi:histidine triad (HIT) family protein
MDCIFCKVIANEVPSYTVYEDDQTRAFLDIMPTRAGHTMVVLKKHGQTILDYSQEELGQLMKSAQVVIRALEKTYNTKVLTIGINHGEVTGVHHLHIHIIPRVPTDGGRVIQSLVSEKLTQPLEEIAASIKAHIA